MKDSKHQVKVGILAPSATELEALKKAVQLTGKGLVCAEQTEYPSEGHSGPVEAFEAASPEVFLVELPDPGQAVVTLQLLHAAQPAAWILVVSDFTDPQFIIESVRLGAREFLSKPVSSDALTQTFERFLKDRRRDSAAKEVRGKVFWITSAKGGAGATSLAINLSASIAELEGSRVALLDLNHPVGDAATYLNIRPNFNVSNALSAGERLDPVLLESYLNSSHGISVLSGSREFRQQQSPTWESMRRLLTVSTRAYTHTIIDLPSTLPPDLLLTLARYSDRILVTLTPELPALWRTHRLLHFLEEGDCRERLFLVLNRFDKRSEITQAEIEKTLEQQISWVLPNDYRSSIQAINSGKPLVSFNHTPLAASYIGLAQELTGLELKKRKKGLFSSIFS